MFPFLIVLSSWLGIQNRKETPNKLYEWIFKLLGWLLFMMSCCGLVSLYFRTSAQLPAHSGGIIGDLIGSSLFHLFNRSGTTLLLITTLLCGITLVTGLSWLWLAEVIGARIYQVCHYLTQYKEFLMRWRKKSSSVIPSIKKNVRQEPLLVEAQPVAPLPVFVPKPVVVPRIESPREKKKIEMDSSIKLKPGTLPPFDLLNPAPPAADKPFTNISFEDLSELVEQRLSDFGVKVKVVAVLPGPVITRFELELAPGIKVSKITGLAKDIARSLSAVSVRVVEVIPGKSVIGLEIPNENREIVTLRDVLESQRYAQSRSPVSLVLGKDISGHPVVVDLTKMPHLLVAGTTGSGKSVSLNAMLLSMLFKATPEQLRFIMIDPKMLELSVYDGIPHLLTPVITDMKDAANALRWCVAEMDKRYRLMAALGVRNIAGYNQKVTEAIKARSAIIHARIL